MTVAIRIGGTTAVGWTRYDIEVDLRTPADAFSLSFAPARRDVWDQCVPDAAVQVLVHGVPVVTGFIDSRTRSAARSGSFVEVSGRCTVGRLIDESMDLLSFSGLTLSDLLARVADPWFPAVAFSNARNRALVRGGVAAPALGPPIVTDRSEAPRKVEPGQTRWEVAQQFLEPAHLLAWSSGDGRELVVGRPSYAQPTLFRFSPRGRGARGAVEHFERTESVAERYSQVTVLGASRGDRTRYGAQVTRHRAVSADGPGPLGTGRDFRHRKHLIVAHDGLRDRADAQRRADRERAVRNATATELSVMVPGHTRRSLDGREVLLAPDAMVEWHDDVLDVRERYVIAGVRYAGSRDGRRTTLALLPEGTELSS